MLKDTLASKQDVTVIDLFSEMEYSFSHILPVDALINTYMTENNLSLQLHNPVQRDRVRDMTILGKRTVVIGDFCVLV